MNNKQKITAVLNAAVTVTVAVFLPLTASADMREDFRAPKGAVRENTGPLFWMHGTETSDRLREYVGRVDESGQGILTIESRPHINWMRPEWWRDVDVVLDECKKRGERVYFVCDGTEGESSAAVTVNGVYAGGFIGAPYRLDVTRSVKAGANTLETKPFRLKNPRIVIVK